MKVNEVPEKLYLLPNGLISYCRNTDEDVEYTCTDAFIEKACEYWYQYNQDIVKGHSEKHILGRGVFTVNVEDFKRYLKGE